MSEKLMPSVGYLPFLHVEVSMQKRRPKEEFLSALFLKRCFLAGGVSIGLNCTMSPVLADFFGEPGKTATKSLRATDTIRKESRMVWFLGQDSGEMYDYGGITALDGDWKKVRPINIDRDDGIPVRATCSSQGRALAGEFMPTRIRVNGPKRKLVDVLPGYSSLLVDHKFKDAVEQFEPDVHQFFPIELVWKDGSPAGSRFWFNPCNRLDSIDREKSTKVFLNKVMQSSPGALVFSHSKIGNHHIWIDKFISGNRPFLTDVLKKELESAGVTGTLFEHHYEEAD